MHKVLLILGLLRRGPRSGYDLHRLVRSHGALYTDVKKANLYYLLDRLAREGALAVRTEPGARGPRGARLIYSLTDAGRARFDELLRTVLRAYDPVHTGVDVAVAFLARLRPAEARSLLAERRETVALRRQQVAAELADAAMQGPMTRIAGDHLLGLIDAELAWVERTLAALEDPTWLAAL